MDYYVYILYSKNLDKFYTGISEYSSKRKRQNCKGQRCWTSRADDWQEIWKTTFDSCQKARELERKIKKRGARRFLVNSDVAIPPQAG